MWIILFTALFAILIPVCTHKISMSDNQLHAIEGFEYDREVLVAMPYLIYIVPHCEQIKYKTFSIINFIIETY